MSRYLRSTQTAAVVLGVLLCARSAAEAQPLGTFRWQVQPYCNVITVTVVQQGAQYQIDGTDDLCGASQQASVVGLAYPNPDGTIGFGLVTVNAPTGASLHTNATISIQTLGGTWRDSAGHSGAFVFTPGAGTSGSLRPAPQPTQGPAGPAGPQGPTGAQGSQGLQGSTGAQGPQGPAGIAFGASVSGSSAGDALAVGNLGAGAGLRGTTASNVTNASGVVGVGSSATGQVVGVTGTATNSPIGTGVVGRGSLTGAFLETTGGPSGQSTPVGVYGLALGALGTGMVAKGTATGLFAESTGVGGTVGLQAKAPSNGFAIKAEGNVTQDRTAGGFVKAMAYVNANGTMGAGPRCFSAQVSGPSCGIGVTRSAAGRYQVDFNFQVSDRFVLIQPVSADTVAYLLLTSTSLDLFSVVNGTYTDGDFVVFVF